MVRVTNHIKRQMENIGALRQLLTLAEYGTFRKAASKLGITHSALSQTVTRMEQNYGVKLFLRNHRETVPTAFGSRILESAASIIEELERAQRDIELMRNLGAGRMVIGADPALAESLLSTGLTSMMERYPELRFTVMSRNWQSMGDDLRERRIDMYVGLAPDHQIEGVSYQKLPLSPPVVVCRSGHPMTERKTVSVADCLMWSIIGCEAPDWFLEHIRSAFPQLFPNLQALRSVFLTSQSLSLLRRILLSTDAVALLPRMLVQDDIEQKRIVSLEVTDYPFPIQISGVIATLEAGPLPPASVELTRMIYQTLRDHP